MEERGEDSVVLECDEGDEGDEVRPLDGVVGRESESSGVFGDVWRERYWSTTKLMRSQASFLTSSERN